MLRKRVVVEKGCYGKGVAENVLWNDVCGKDELWKGGDCGKVDILEELYCGRAIYLS